MGEITYNYRERIERAQVEQSTTRLKMSVVKVANLEGIPLFIGLSDKQLDWLRSRLHPHSFPANKEMIVTGMPGDVVYFVLSGTVKVYIPQPDGEDVIVTILGPGDPVGEMSIVDHGGRSANVITLEETHVLWMSQDNFKEGLQMMPVMAQNLMRILSNRLRNSTGQFQAMAALDVNGRLIRQLLAFAMRYGVSGPDGEVVIPIRLTQYELASLIGASRKRVNQAMVVLKRKGWIAIDGCYHITILDRAALESSLE
jgi:CRP-like cAMP-binding protein